MAREWTQNHGVTFTADQINCDGCQADGRATDWTAKLCPIRQCCREKQVETCAECELYACEKAEAFLKAVPGARANLDARRA